jgi:hypothetical protein
VAGAVEVAAVPGVEVAVAVAAVPGVAVAVAVEAVEVEVLPARGLAPAYLPMAAEKRDLDRHRRLHRHWRPTPLQITTSCAPDADVGCLAYSLFLPTRHSSRG